MSDIDDNIDKMQRKIEGRCSECGFRKIHGVGCKYHRDPEDILFSKDYRDYRYQWMGPSNYDMSGFDDK